MRREINLSGGQITLLKTTGLTGAPAYKKLLIERTSEMEQAELPDELNGLISLGQVLSDKVNLHSMEDVERAIFRVNASYARDLRDALNPGSPPRARTAASATGLSSAQ